ncbi:serine carboxypeptidase family protein [Hyphomonas neptunium ATCC 15444]|uniref:Serine carboxypeptidase family protein n=2 Tax=Hyphomonas TaxID=85 RepID=Q0BZ12_HYPNA|nr:MULTISPECIES: serine carboxypeptidase family protein [Hyphomonas]ABI76411.1 serine carboxypeptidase family protein [Hyphomonas neptunium ATCC 15444]KCZ87277.1 serine carboxypeptidase family protein [Hyphomonas hirschiana VP5]
MKNTYRRLLYCLTAGTLVAGCVSAQPATPAADASLPEASVSAGPAAVLDTTVPGRGMFGGAEIDYTAAIETFRVTPDGGLPPADLVAISYVAAAGAATDERPVLFVFNGGPISASLWLHIGALGPQRVSAPDDLNAPLEQYALVQNPHSPLDAADMVFFDPASTGFSRVIGDGDASQYFSVQTDAAQFVAFAQAWLEKHDREGAPAFILGESYGTHRAAEAAGQIAEAGKLNLEGVFLMGQAVNIVEYSQRKQNILSYIASLPTLAAIAWDLGEVDKGGRSFEDFIAQAQAFGETEYLGALFKGQRISPEELADVAAKLEGYTGIPAAYYIESRLRISKEQFRVELLKDKGLILGRSDGRYTGPIGDGRSDPSSILQQAYSKLFAAYFSETFEDISLTDYKETFSAGPGFDSWDWGAASPFGHFAYAERIDAAFKAYPDFRVFVGTGYHDTMTTVGAASYLIDQSDWPESRVRSANYIGGHMAYSVDGSAQAFGEDIRSWIRGWAEMGEGE